MAVSRSNLLSLPTELLEIVIHNIDRKDVKNLRLVCHDFNDMCEKDLFEIIVLLPFRNCLQGFASLFKTRPHLAKLVHFVVYNQLWVGLLESDYQKRAHQGLDQDASVLRARDDIIPRTEALTYETGSEESDHLRAIFRLLPNLRDVSVYGLDDDSLGYELSKDHVPRYLERIIDIPSMGPPWSFEVTHREDASASSCTLIALSEEGRSLETFRGKGFDPTALTDSSDETTTMRVPSKLRELISGLRYLDISIDKDQIYDSYFNNSFVSVLRAAPKLTTLGLRFNARNDPRYNRLESGEAKLMEMINTSGLFFPSLEKLNLGDLMCREEDLNGFLFRHADTLSDLELTSVSLVQGKSAYTCAIRVLERLRKLNLDTFAINGYLSNHGTQSLWFGSDNEEGEFWRSLRAETSSWVTRQTDKTPEVLRRVAIIEGNEDFVPPEEKVGEEVLWRILFDLFWNPDFVENGVLHSSYIPTALLQPAGHGHDQADQLATAVETDLTIQESTIHDGNDAN